MNVYTLVVPNTTTNRACLLCDELMRRKRLHGSRLRMANLFWTVPSVLRRVNTSALRTCRRFCSTNKLETKQRFLVSCTWAICYGKMSDNMYLQLRHYERTETSMGKFTVPSKDTSDPWCHPILREWYWCSMCVSGCRCRHRLTVLFTWLQCTM